jgi:hypothetical protein
MHLLSFCGALQIKLLSQQKLFLVRLVHLVWTELMEKLEILGRLAQRELVIQEQLVKLAP